MELPTTHAAAATASTAEDRIMDLTSRFLEGMNQNMVHQTLSARVMVQYKEQRTVAALEYERGWRTTRQNTLRSMKEDLMRQINLPMSKNFRFSRRLRNEKAEPVDFDLVEISPDTVRNDDMIIVQDVEEAPTEQAHDVQEPAQEPIQEPAQEPIQEPAQEPVTQEQSLEPEEDNTDAI